MNIRLQLRLTTHISAVTSFVAALIHIRILHHSDVPWWHAFFIPITLLTAFIISFLIIAHLVKVVAKIIEP